jgi:hypothetical protein|tara:strand:- start:257 stop:853 length:597 start_codon:yes stop_codon:yes gene_type:complete
MGRAIDLLITYRVIKLLVTPFEKTKAFKLGIIDKAGKVLRKARTLKTSEEKTAYTLLHRFVFNLKRMIHLVPGGKSKIGTYAAALVMLLREDRENYLNSNDIEKALYRHLVENDLIKYDNKLREGLEMDYLPKGRFTVTDELRDLHNEITADVGDLVSTKYDIKPSDKFFGVNIYELYNEDRNAKVVISEDNIERLRL